jgi:WD40 repeat protein
MTRFLGRRILQRAILVLPFLCVTPVAHAQALSQIVDDRTGIALSLPLDLLVNKHPAKWGTTWQTTDRRLTIETLDLRAERTLVELYAKLKRIRGRRLTASALNPGSFVIEGQDRDGKSFYVTAAERDGNVHGLSIIYFSPSSKALVHSIANSFLPFSETADTQQLRRHLVRGSPAEMVREPQRTPTKPLVTLEPNIGVIDESTRVIFAPGNRVVATITGKRTETLREPSAIKLWDVASGLPLRTLQHSAYLTSAVFTADAAAIVTAHRDNTIKIWDITTGSNTVTFRVGGDGEWFDDLSLSNDGTTIIAVSGYDGRPNSIVSIINLLDGKQFRLELVRRDDWGTLFVKFNKSGTRLIAVAGHTVNVWDTKTLELVSSRSIDPRYTLFQDSILDENKFLVQLSDADCPLLSLFFVDLNTRAPPIPIQTAATCNHPKDSDLSYGEFVSFWHEQTQQLYFTRKQIPGVKVWNLRTKRISVADHWPDGDKGRLISASSGLALRAVLSNGRVQLYNLKTGALISELAAHGHAAENAIASDSGGYMALSRTIRAGGATYNQLLLWPAGSANPTFLRLTDNIDAPRQADSETNLIIHDVSMAAGIAVGRRGGEVVLFSTKTGAALRRFFIGGNGARLHLSPDGKWIFVRYWGDQSPSNIAGVVLDARDGSVKLKFEKEANRDRISVGAFSPDGKLLVICSWSELEVWSMQTFQIVKRIGPGARIDRIAFSPDSQSLIGTPYKDNEALLWSVAEGALVRIFKRGDDALAAHSTFETVTLSHNRTLVAAGLSQAAYSSGDIGGDNGIVVWDAISGKYRFTLRGHEGGVSEVTFSPDDRWLISAGYDGTIRYWEAPTGNLAATFASSSQDQWIIITEKGFFAASSAAGDLISIVRGLEVTKTDQLWQSLYDPDLVHQYLAGDGDGEVREAAKVLDLDKVLDSGAVPQISIAATGTSSSDLAEVTASITDRGGGIGRVEWRVNGITVAVSTSRDKPTGGAPPYHTLKQLVALEPGDNIIEVVVYNGRNLLASLPDRTAVKFNPPVDSAKPKLYVVAIGINAYVDRGWSPPGRLESMFPPLTLAVADAIEFGAAMTRAATGLYGQVRLITALDGDATRAKLDQAIDTVAAEIHPRDTFILFAAAHGITDKGKFFIIPQDYDGGANPSTLAEYAIDQNRLQDWLANRIRAKRAIVFLDTCESGSLVSGHSRFGSEAAVGRLHESTGRPILTAAAAGQFAHEGIIAGLGDRHGVFTWALLDSLRNGDTNGDGLIELSEVVTHVQIIVPRIAAQLGGVGRAEVALPEPVFGKQTPRFGSRGEDFPLVRRLQ